MAGEFLNQDYRATKGWQTHLRYTQVNIDPREDGITLHTKALQR